MGDKVIASVIHSGLGGVIERPELTDESRHGFSVKSRIGSLLHSLIDGVIELADEVTEQKAEDCLLTNSKEEEVSEDNVDRDEDEASEGGDVLRLRGGGEPMTWEDVECINKNEIVEFMESLGIVTDLTQNLDRLRKVLLAHQIQDHIALLLDSTVARVLKHFGKEVSKKKDRNRIALKMLYIGNDLLQCDILEQITIAETTSPSGSESDCSGTPNVSDISQSDLSSPCAAPSSSHKAPGKLSSSNTPATHRGCASATSATFATPNLTPCTASPVSTSHAGNGGGQFLKLPWTMSKAELISFLTEENGVPPPARQRESHYRDKVGMAMVNNMLKKLDLDQVTEVLEKLHYTYDKHIARRANSLRTHFQRKEANDEQTKFKQHNILFLMMETVKAKSKTKNVFQFPSPVSSSADASSPSVLDSKILGTDKKSFFSGPESAPPLSANNQNSFSGSMTGSNNQNSFSGSPCFKSPSVASATQHNSFSSSKPAKLNLHAPPKRQKTAHPAAQHQELAHQVAQVGVRPRVQVRFYNGGNWCYLNGLLNLLFSVPRFIEILFEQDTFDEVQMKDPANVPVLLELRRLALSGQDTVVKTDNLRLLLGAPWTNNTQQCSSDFFTSLYERIECHNLAKVLRIEDTEEDRCVGSDCPPTYRHEQLRVILKLPPNGESLQHILDQYSTAQQIDLVEPLHPNCGIKTVARRNIISSNGEVMLFHLHRYTWDMQRGALDRIDQAIAVPLSLQVDNKVWHLTGGLRNSSVLNTTTQGHYTGVTRDMSTGLFYKHNDQQRLEPLYGNRVTDFLNRCYMLAYTLEESLPGGLAPPPLAMEGLSGDAATGLTPNRRKNDQVILDQTPAKKRCINAAGDNGNAGSAGSGAPGISPELFDFKQPNPKSKVRKPRAKPVAARKGNVSNMKQFVNDFNPTPDEQADIRANIELRRQYLAERLARLKRNDFSMHGLPYNPVFEGILKMYLLYCKISHPWNRARFSEFLW